MGGRRGAVAPLLFEQAETRLDEAGWNKSSFRLVEARLI